MKRTIATALGAMVFASPLLAVAPVTIVPGVQTYAQRDATANLAGVVVSLAAGSLRETTRTNGVALVAAMALERAPIDGVPLRDAVAALGGTLASEVSARAVRFYLEAPPEQLGPCLSLLARALAVPSVNDAAVSAARTLAVGRASEADRLPLEVGLGMVRQAYYAGVAGQPVGGRSATLAGVTTADVNAFIAATYRRTGAATAAVGAVDDAALASLAALVAALPSGGAPIPHIRVNAPTAAPRRIVAHRDIGAPWLVLGFAAPAPGGRDYPAMLVLEAMLAATFDDSAPTTQSVYGRGTGYVYATDLQPAQFAIYVNGSRTDVTAGLRNVDVVVKGLALRPVRAEVLARAKTRASGGAATAALTLADRASELVASAEYARDLRTTDTLAAIASVTAADVRSVATKYLQRFTAAIVLPRERGTSRGAGS